MRRLSDLSIRQFIVNPGRLVSTLLLLSTTCACSAQGVQQQGVVDEEELARRDVWHAAKLRGVAFRAVGQEPGWLLEITNGEQFLLLTDYGQQRTVLPYVEPQEDKLNRKTLFQINAGTSVLIEGQTCVDSMSGETFEVSVTVSLDGRQYKGCGRALF